METDGDGNGGGGTTRAGAPGNARSDPGSGPSFGRGRGGERPLDARDRAGARVFAGRPLRVLSGEGGRRPGALLRRGGRARRPDGTGAGRTTRRRLARGGHGRVG